MRALSHANYTVHISNHHCVENVTEQLASASRACADVERTCADATATLEASAAALNDLAAQHGRFRRTQAQQSTIAELLDAPALADMCVRTGLFEELLDVHDYVIALSWGHQLWRGEAQSSTSEMIIRRVVDGVRAATQDMRVSVLSQLAGSSKVPLPGALRLLGSLRRLYAQCAAEAARVATGDADAPPVVVSPDEDAAIVARVRGEYLQCRHAWHAAELDALPRANAFLYLSRVTDIQRSHWADIASQYVAVSATLKLSEASLAPLEPRVRAQYVRADALAARAQLAAWLASRTQWFLATLRESLKSVEDGTQVASLLQQVTFASRRAGRIGADFSQLIDDPFHGHIRDMFRDRLAAGTTAFADSVTAWGWAHKTGYDPDALSAGRPDATDASADACTPPLALLRHAPLAELTNDVIIAFNTVRPCFPVSGCTWARSAVADALTRAATALRDAATADGSPAARINAARARAKASAAAFTPALSDDDARATARFTALCGAYTDMFVPYVCVLLRTFEALATGEALPPFTWSSIAAAGVYGSADVDEAWAACRVTVTDAVQRCTHGTPAAAPAVM